MEKLCIFSELFIYMVNLITRMVSVEVIWRLYGGNVKSDTFYGDVIIKLVGRLLAN